MHPTEILAVLRLRDLLGLPNPTRIDHPLMQTPYAQITCTPEFLASQDQRDELLDKFLNTVRQRDTGTARRPVVNRERAQHGVVTRACSSGLLLCWLWPAIPLSPKHHSQRSRPFLMLPVGQIRLNDRDVMCLAKDLVFAPYPKSGSLLSALSGKQSTVALGPVFPRGWHRICLELCCKLGPPLGSWISSKIWSSHENK